MKRSVISLLLFSIGAVLGPFHEVKGTIPLWELFAVLLASFAATAIMFFGLKSLLNNDNKAVILIFLSFFFFFFFGEIQSFADAQLASYIRRRWIAVILLCMFAVAGFLVLLSRKQLNKLGDFTHLISRVMGVASIAYLVVAFNSGPQLHARTSRVLENENLQSEVQPDIYFLLFDAYTSVGSLKKYWGYEDAVFLSFLTSNGFQILTNGQANYVSTPFCLSAVLNMEFATVDHRKNTHPKLVNFLWKDIQNSEVPQKLQDFGYEIHNLSFFPVLNKPGIYKCPEVQFLSLTGLIIKKSPIGYYLEGKERWGLGEINLNLIEKLKTLAKAGSQPKFVYAHFMMPHQPYIFAHDGSRLPLGLEQSTRKKEFYVEQVGFVNRKIEEMVSEILKHAKTPPIIIIQGDHGFRFLEGPEQVDEAKSAFHAYLLPAGKNIPDTLTGVNTFRYIFREFFNAKVDLLPDKQFLSPLEFE